jgi:hypothetical protein
MLWREGQYVPLTPKALETLTVLVEHGGRIVEKEEFLRQVWPDTFVEDVTLAKERLLLAEDSGRRVSSTSYIETIPEARIPIRGRRAGARCRRSSGSDGAERRGRNCRTRPWRAGTGRKECPSALGPRGAGGGAGDPGGSGPYLLVVGLPRGTPARRSSLGRQFRSPVSRATRLRWLSHPMGIRSHMCKTVPGATASTFVSN